MLKGIHFLLSYVCNFECDHCFLHCSPRSKGTFTLEHLCQVLEDARSMDTIDTIYFEGGEPFLFYPILLAGTHIARGMGFSVGIVTNGYWGTSVSDAEAWLKPLSGLGISDLSVSEDAFHYGEEKHTPAGNAIAAAKKLEIPTGRIAISPPCPPSQTTENLEKAAPLIGGGVKFKGRAAEKLTEGLPDLPWDSFNECPHEKIRDPARIHIDPFGHVQICQGIVIGNAFDTNLSTIMRQYHPQDHPICGPLEQGGPARLARLHAPDHRGRYVDACHFCYLTRRSLIDRFPSQLAPRQVYGRSTASPLRTQ